MGRGLVAASREFTQHTEYAGVDKICIQYRLDKELSDGSDEVFTSQGLQATWLPGGGLAYAKGTIKGPNDASIMINIYQDASFAKVEFNPSRLLDPEGSTLCHPDLVKDTVGAIIVFLGRRGVVPSWYLDRSTGEIRDSGPNSWPADWEDQVNILRLDIARDFYSPFKDFSVSKLKDLHISGYPDVSFYANNGVINTLSWGSSNHVRHSLYNKSLKHDGDAEGGWTRFEIQQRGYRLKTQGISSLCDINADSVFTLLWDRWDASGLNKPISIGEGGRNLVELLSKVLPPAKVATFIGLAYLKMEGIPLKLNPKTLMAYRKIGESVGFILGSSLENLGSVEVQINFNAGLVEALPQSSSEFTRTHLGIDETIHLETTA